MINRLLTAALLTSAFASPLCAQEDFSKVEVKAEQLAPGVSVLFGAGGNIGVSHGEDGTVLIDDQFAPLTPKIQAAVAALGASPVKFLINTHWHGDHSGGNENFGKAGALIMAHDNVRVRMASDQTTQFGEVKASPKVALPVITYAEGLKLHLNGEEVRVISVPPAHTDGDSIVHWTKSNVIHMGDLFFHKMSFPFVDRSSGGDVRGVIAAAEKTLAMADDQTKIIPGHGPGASRAELLAYPDMVSGIVGKIDGAIKSGKTLEEIKAMKPADGYGVNPSGFITADRFIEMVYGTLKPA
ncbi:MBL fold metallo-hydrolase [uncultured Sphingorhabdus sp.]|uniref:MBL fold metallo-hydrolase n=1 Tax=uncultured Sphingorhabdus sp. TaxID=1686106 RepID=UPI002619CC6A|nr:MBL fold metallo-hydrolase [uncultured Sphingorhabdus sp.]HMS21216.1 MBL fold metallo-hydrolase [Sphingorhabdus sp.]